MINRENCSKKKVFCALLPPPNITGRMHLGHFFDQMISNIYIKKHKKENFDTLFVPFIDHGGISTEVLIKKQFGNLDKENILSFEKEYKGYILEDLINSSFSFNKNYCLYTLDEDFKKLINKIFFSLYEDNLLKRFYYIVNWCSKCNTVISDEELLYKEKKQKMFFLKYFYDTENYVLIATTKPETIYADEFIITDIKDHPKSVKIPVLNKKIPVIYSPKNVSKEKGTSYVKITPSLDKKDFYIYESIFNKTPILKNYYKDIQIDSLNKYIYKTEYVTSNIPVCYRCNYEITNTIKKQWFVDLQSMSKNIVLENIELFPDTLKEEIQFLQLNTHFWCISRQLKFGHPIPHYCDLCNKFIDKSCSHEKQQKEVFDSWFVSSLCSIYHYEKTGIHTNFLSCGRDILLFWVIKMISMNRYFFKKEIFKTIFCHNLLKDKNNNKLSKSKGNYIPLQELKKRISDNGIVYILLNSFKKSEDTKIIFSSRDFDNFCIKISNAIYMYNSLRNFTNQNLEIEKHLDSYFNFIHHEFEILINKFEIKKAFVLVKDFIFNHIFNFYFEILKKTQSFSSFAFTLLNKSFNLLSIFFPRIEDIFPLYQECEMKLSYDIDYKKYFETFFFVKETRMIKHYIKDVCVYDKDNKIPFYIKKLLNMQYKEINNSCVIGNSCINNCLFLSSSTKNTQKENIQEKISKLENDLYKINLYGKKDFNSFSVKKNKSIELNILKILLSNEEKNA